ncbi:MAG: AMP-binding protein [Burkholderiaceae bacterium]|nr:AMP-binding protein [Burkholderiaceae bacterium]
MRESRELPLTTIDEARRYRTCGAWPDETTYERFERIATKHLGKVAIIEAGRSWTYGEVLEEVRALSRGLRAAGIAQGEVVSVQLSNSAMHAISHLALNRIGALAMPVHDSWHEAELPHLLKVSRTVAAIIPGTYRGLDYAALYADLRSQLPNLRAVYAMDGAGLNAQAYSSLLTVREGEGEIAATRIDPDLPGALMLSSGTTSMPKISLFSSNNLHALLAPFWSRIQLRETDVGAALAPVGTGAIGYVYPLLSPLLNGATTAILERWTEPQVAVDLIRRNRCTYATAVPAQITQMLPIIQAAPRSDFDSFRCFTNAGAPLAPEVGSQIEEHMDCKIFVIYGATDGGVAASSDINDPQEKRLGSVGRAQDECEIRLVDEIGQEVEPGQTGEIQWRSADKSYGYLNDPEATAMAFNRERFYRTGDLGVLDAEGYLRIVGRVKDMIIRGGRNISPRLIEEMVARHPQVLDVAVAAYPDKVLGERACAFVVSRPGAQMTLKAMLEFLKNEQMSVWQMPERLELMDELPRSAGGKVMKNKLRQFVADKVAVEEHVEAGTMASAV